MFCPIAVNIWNIVYWRMAFTRKIKGHRSLTSASYAATQPTRSIILLETSEIIPNLSNPKVFLQWSFCCYPVRVHTRIFIGGWWLILWVAHDQNFLRLTTNFKSTHFSSFNNGGGGGTQWEKCATVTLDTSRQYILFHFHIVSNTIALTLSFDCEITIGPVSWCQSEGRFAKG